MSYKQPSEKMVPRLRLLHYGIVGRYIYEINGVIHYTTCQIINEEGVLCMFHPFASMPRLICMELNVEVVNAPSSCQVNDTIWTEMEKKLQSSMKLE